MSDPIYFSRQLVKGRIAEILFEQMHRDAGNFTILAFGYENVLPELANKQRSIQNDETMEIIRRAPDFAVIDHETHDVLLIEVKYLRNPTPEYILKDAERMFSSWKSAYLFLATPEGFFMDKAKTILDNKGKISPYVHKCVPKKLQDSYLKILNEYIR